MEMLIQRIKKYTMYGFAVGVAATLGVLVSHEKESAKAAHTDSLFFSDVVHADVAGGTGYGTSDGASDSGSGDDGGGNL